MKKYLFTFNGTIVLNAASYNDAENVIEDLNVNDYVIHEDLFETDEHYISPNIKIRESQIGTYHHPLNDPEQFEQFKIRQCNYNSIFNDFLNSMIDKQELIERIEQVDDEKDVPEGCDSFTSIEMVEIGSKEMKIVRLLTVA